MWNTCRFVVLYILSIQVRSVVLIVYSAQAIYVDLPSTYCSAAPCAASSSSSRRPPSARVTAFAMASTFGIRGCTSTSEGADRPKTSRSNASNRRRSAASASWFVKKHRGHSIHQTSTPTKATHEPRTYHSDLKYKDSLYINISTFFIF